MTNLSSIVSSFTFLLSPTGKGTGFWRHASSTPVLLFQIQLYPKVTILLPLLLLFFAPPLHFLFHSPHLCGMSKGYQGWSSERVPLPSSTSRGYRSNGVVLPLTNGRALPSKWEDAEKWILSPLSGDGNGKLSFPPPHHRRPKSKSGPLAQPAGINGLYPSNSPVLPCFDRAGAGNFAVGSPFSTGVMVRRGSKESGRGGGGGSGGENGEPCIVRSTSLYGWSDVLIESSSSLPSSRDEEIETTREGPVILTKDVATQMSSEGSTPTERLSFSHSPSVYPIAELESQFSKLEVRDVQVDDQVTATRWSKRHVSQSSDKRSTNIIDLIKGALEAEASSWELKETEKRRSKCKREEAKITAWENLQKAKAEAAIQKLEMKLEKKRSSSMDKILSRLKSAQQKAKMMRTAVSADQAQYVARTSKRISYFSKTGRISSCFICQAF
ncbi:uncharacterized protein [Typha angustifolia]|uniref:uncharacterized protein isoform X2 n=1 Tax=Typha angustifolia TaxID=59011 RepID=UPI003C2F041C